MSEATNTPAPLADAAQARLGEVIAERFGTVPTYDVRARVIAVIHALAAFLLDHPDVPVPSLVRVHCQTETLLELEQLAEHFGAKVYGHPAHRQFEIPVGDDVGQIIVSYDAAAGRPL